jgi:hypothetical protein
MILGFERGGTYGGCFGSGEEEVKALAVIPELLLLGQTLCIAHDISENTAVLGVLDCLIDILGNRLVHDLEHLLDVLAQVVGHEGKYVCHFACERVVPHHVGAGKEALDPCCETRFPALLRDEAHWFAECVLRNDVGGEAVECFLDIEGAFAGGCEHFVGGHFGKVVYFALELEHLLAAEEAIQWCSTDAMEIMVYGGEAGDSDWACAACVELMNPFVAGAAGSCVDFVCEGRIGAVKFIGVDSGRDVSSVLSIRWDGCVYLMMGPYVSCMRAITLPYSPVCHQS